MKKLLFIIVMLLLTGSIVFGAETGTKITRDVDDFVRVLVINENSGMSATAGFKAVNDSSRILQIYIESDSAGADAWIKNDTGHLRFGIPTGKDYKWEINDVVEMTLNATGLSNVAWTGTVIGVPYGGTGLTEMANGGILLGSADSPVTVMSRLTSGQIVVGHTTGDPVALTAFTSSTGDLKHEAGGLEFDASAIADGGIIVGTGAGTMALRATALTGGATGFFKHEVGGLEADVSAYTGLIKITGGATSNITDKAGLEGCMSDVANFAEADGDSYSGTHDFASATVNLGTGAVDATGEIANNIIDLEHFKHTQDWGEIRTDADGYLIIEEDAVKEEDLKAVDAAADENILTYESTTGDFEWHIPSELITAGTNLDWDGNTLNASLTAGDMRITYGNYLYWWDNGASADAQEGNWRDFCNASGDLVREYYTGGAWVEKREEKP